MRRAADGSQRHAEGPGGVSGTRQRDGVGSARWRGADLLRVVVLYLGLHLAVLIVLTVLDLPTESPTVPTSFGEIVRQLAASGATIAALVLVARSRGGVRALLPLHIPDRRWMTWAVGIAAALLAGKAALMSALPADASLPSAVIAGGMLSMGLATAVEEELLYRGAVYAWLLELMRPAFAAVVSAGVFAIVHVGAEPGSLGSAFLFGLLFARLYRRSGSLLPGLVIHAVNNAGTLLVVALP